MPSPANRIASIVSRIAVEFKLIRTALSASGAALRSATPPTPSEGLRWVELNADGTERYRWIWIARKNGASWDWLGPQIDWAANTGRVAGNGANQQAIQVPPGTGFFMRPIAAWFDWSQDRPGMWMWNLSRVQAAGIVMPWISPEPIVATAAKITGRSAPFFQPTPWMWSDLNAIEWAVTVGGIAAGQTKTSTLHGVFRVTFQIYRA